MNRVVIVDVAIYVVAALLLVGYSKVGGFGWQACETFCAEAALTTDAVLELLLTPLTFCFCPGR